jgi:hypothetical protein
VEQVTLPNGKYVKFTSVDPDGSVRVFETNQATDSVGNPTSVTLTPSLTKQAVLALLGALSV